MLSRIAESLFWIGRYVERSDGTARILDVHLQLLLEDPWIDEDTACRSLLSVMGTDLPPGKLVTREDVINDLAVDRQHPGSIAFAIASARENARRAREIVSTELWECLNSTNARIPKKVAAEKTHEYFRWVRERAALAWTEVLTRIPEHGVPNELYERVRTQFSEKELSDLTFIVMSINAWNRANVAFKTVPGAYDAAFGLDKANLN